MDKLQLQEVQELVEIVNKASQFLTEEGFEFEDPLITAINYDTRSFCYVVSFDCDYTSHEFINVWVRRTGSGYLKTHHSYETPEFII